MYKRILYPEDAAIIELIPAQNAKELFLSILRYDPSTGEIPEMTNETKAYFLSFKQKMDMDFKKYQKTCEKNKSNGLKGGRPQKETIHPTIEKEEDNEAVKQDIQYLNDNYDKDEIISTFPQFYKLKLSSTGGEMIKNLNNADNLEVWYYGRAE